ncbi:hypothetical protein RHMOL_Rhmol11G0195500 [Rhododendron molle]|uniref:Uncharacterized protein n=1 Tax=Rhododendron molle TaxID=49168 RepID=A0ACC0LVR3_RHOML|nr:hypothetical protein RHMOL_Rhmol11G0195500 [Rhododendron molle]
MSKFGLVDGFENGRVGRPFLCVFKDPPTRKSRPPGFAEEEKEEEKKKFPYYAMLLTLLFLGLIVLWSPLDASPFAQKSARRFFGDGVYADYFSFCLEL